MHYYCMVLFLIVRTLIVTSSSIWPVEGNINDDCIQRCPLQNKTQEGSLDVECGNECRISQCMRGCTLWQLALDSSCQVVCNGTQEHLPSRELHCIIGCNDALNRYFHKIREKIGTPPAPALVADTLTATSLSLEWEGPRYSNISYLVQWRYELSGGWQYCCNQSWGPHSTILVENLRPYTKYRFRIAMLLSPHHSEPIVSASSVVIITRPSGIPSSPPTIVRVTAVDSSRISISWEPGPFPNGPILSYVLQIKELPEGYSALKDIPTAENNNFYMCKNLLPSKNYSIALSMRNAVGEGPSTCINVSTPAEPTVKKLEPVLILGSPQAVIKQVLDITIEPVYVYQTSSIITGVAIHVNQNLLFIANSDGYIIRTLLDDYKHPDLTTPSVIFSPTHTNFKPLELSIDWLNDHLYILGEIMHDTGPRWQIARCGLDGQMLTIAVAGFIVKPFHMEVDPYNGYLFWVISGTSRGGLYRLDLADISNGVKHEVQPQIISNDNNLGAFTVDHINFRLLVSKTTENKVVSMSLNGQEVSDIHSNTQNPMFNNISSLVMVNDIFCWTSGSKLLVEEYSPEQDSYFHNAYPDFETPSFISLNINLPTSQPVPIPVNPPTNLQAIMGSDLAKTSWQLPHLLGEQGKGAWQNWSYEVQVRNDLNEISQGDINSTSFIIQNLEENTEYIMKVAAYTSSGMGPWSTEFRGKTLRSPRDGKFASILWSAAQGLLKSDVTGENVETLIHFSNLKDYRGDYHITDITWYEDILYLATNTTNVMWYSMASHDFGHLPDIDSVGSIAVDWIGKKLYWSDPKQQLINRRNFNGSQQEPLPILTQAKELNIDSAQAFIYWSTAYAVECARLNGMQRRTYYPAEIFSGRQVMGLTLDTDHRFVYWVVRSSEGSALYQAPTAEIIPLGQEIEPIIISYLKHPNMQGPLYYFSDHLLWLQDDRNAVIGDMSGQNTAVISGISLSGLNTMAVVDDSLQHQLPSIFHYHEEVNVIPEPVQSSSIQVTGTWKFFKIEWDPIVNVRPDLVFYEVKVDDRTRKALHTCIVANRTYCVYSNLTELTPYTKLIITIKAFTYWATSGHVRAVLRSPPSLPSVPTNPRVFVSYVRNPIRNNQDIIAVFRWNHPAKPNGKIEGYKVKCWYVSTSGETHNCEFTEPNFEKLEFTAHKLQRNSTYYFQVQAYTEAGQGELTEAVHAETNIEMPVPKLLLSTVDAVKITDYDKHENQNVSQSSSPVDLAFISQDDKVFWLSKTQELLACNINCSSKYKKILTLNSTGLSLTVDWIGLFIYWSEYDGEQSTIYRLDLSQWKKGRLEILKILKRSKPISKINVSPFKSSLFWIEESEVNNGVGYLMTSKSDGTSVRPFFRVMQLRKRRGIYEDYCNCPEDPVVYKVMTVNHTDTKNPQVLWVDGIYNHVYSADTDGCYCTLLVNATVNSNAGLPPTSVTMDQHFLYWSNETEGKIYSLSKSGDDHMDEGVRALNVSGVRQITALGQHLQPYPEPYCLSPQQLPHRATLLENNSTSLKLQLPSAKQYITCEDITMATVEYTVYYHREDEVCEISLDKCNKIVTYENILQVRGLKPFSRYVFHVAMKNYYSDLERISPIIGPSAIFQTAAGAPSPPRNVSARVINPTLVEVLWYPPEEFNDEAVRYQVHWQMEGMVVGDRQKGERNISGMGIKKNSMVVPHRTEIQLLSGQKYFIWIRANSKNSKFYTNSEGVMVEMFPQPNNINLLQSSPYGLNISWMPTQNVSIVKYDLQYKLEKTDGDWLNVHDKQTFAETEDIHFFIRGLLPKHMYIFRLVLIYSTSLYPYVWPLDDRFKYETLGDKPSPPGMPVIQNIKLDLYQVVWEPSRDNGAKIELYSLEGKTEQSGSSRVKREANFTANKFGNMVDIIDNDWEICYNGTDNHWIITDLSPSLRYVFRVQSKNSYGWSDYSSISESFDFTEAAMLAQQQELSIVLGISVPIVVVLLCVTGMLTFMYVFRQREKEKKSLQILTLGNVVRGPDAELATLRELPRQGNFVHNTNALYTTADIPTDEEIALLPRIRRDQITLTKFLGSGAFGEVFEGTAKNLPNSGGGETKVAVKTLRKGATEQEKGEFLKEAQLMSNFKHAHILQLLGVCLDNDPNFIIMELMEGGDLLSFLRSSRPLLYPGNALTLLDLITMCVDVARGCRYLEEMHFVHRDLACRNCLVSSRERSARIVKIGDFGLARDIYKNDYYRKEGEGLLPVRWMAPESLVDGVFTCHSDVWAFGVLIWEIMTLGQQPYPARTNLEVLHYVRNGGRLGRPNSCPEELHQLMLRCWSYNPENRPTFKYCLDVLEDLKNKSLDITLNEINHGHYMVRTRNGGIHNRAFFEDENHNNSSGSSWRTNSEMGSIEQIHYSEHALRNVQQTPQHQNNEVPKYLELLHDDSDTATTISDGYEIPRSSLRKEETVSKEHVLSEGSKTESENRNRTLSTSSTLSDASESTTASLLRGCKADDIKNNQEINNLVADSVITNGCININKNTSVPASRRNGEKDVTSLEKLLPLSKRINGLTSSIPNTLDNKAEQVVSYSNVTGNTQLIKDKTDIPNKYSENMPKDSARNKIQGSYTSVSQIC